MQAYKAVNGTCNEAQFEVDGIGFGLFDLEPEEEAAIARQKLHEKYYILYEWDFESHADNDGGIDAWDFGEKEIPLNPEESILLDGKIIGFYSCHRIFLLAGGVSYAGGRGSENIGGWGSVSSSVEYTLKKKEK